MSLNGSLESTVDGDVEFRFEVTNVGPGPVELTFRSGKRGDVSVTDTETGETVWDWAAGRMFTQAISTVELESGETLELTFTWNDPPAGSYEARAALEARRNAQASATFSVA